MTKPEIENIDQEINQICIDRNVSLADVKKRTRGEQHIADTRHIIVYSLYRIGMTYVQIGKYLGGRHHTTIMHSINMVSSRDFLFDDFTKINSNER